MHRALAPLLVAALVGSAIWLGCGTLGLEDSDGTVAARIGGDVITVGELDAAIKEDLFQRETRDGNPSRLHEVRSRALEGLLAERAVELEADRRGVSTEELLRAEADALGPVSDAEVETFYRENAAQLRGAPLEQVAPRIRTHLEDQRQRKAVEAIVAAADVSVELERPRVEVSAGGPSLGPDDARVTIVEFSDFQCPYCRRAMPVIDEVMERYPEDVRVVYRHLPLDSLHPRARAGAEAAACAGEQDKFWPYHDLLFENSRALADEDLRRYAEQIELDAERFDECVSSRRYRDAVESDVQEARKLGITGTPAFVVNGIIMTGLQTTDALDAIIREELGLAASDS